MNDAPLPEHPRARPDVVFRRLDAEWVIFDPRNQELHALNLTAALVWEYCSGEATVDEIAEAVGGAFASAPNAGDVHRDVRETLARFARAGLLA